MAIGIIGSGAWGTALACVAANNEDVILYSRDPHQAQTIETSRYNNKYLPDVELSSKIRVTSDKHELEKISHAILAVPSIAFRKTIQEFNFLDENISYMSVTKGLEQKTNLRMSQVILEEDTRKSDTQIAVLSGPNLAREIATGHLAATVIASSNQTLAGELQKIFHTEKFRVYTSSDVVGCEIAGVSKNVVAIAAGIGDGMGYGDNAKATVMTRALAEIARLGIAEGGNSATFYGLAGIGDLIATCSSALSRNRTVGFQLGQGKTIEDIRNESHDIAEGIFSASALLKRANELGVEMPIVQAVAKVVEQGKVSPESVAELMSRPPGKE